MSPAFYSYWSGVGSSGFEVSDQGSAAAWPPSRPTTTSPSSSSVSPRMSSTRPAATSRPPSSARSTWPRHSVSGCRSGKREERFHAASDLAGYFRKPYGPGWALVGDAGYHLHPITAQGITDAFLDAERLTDALDATFTERSTYDDAMTAYQRARDEAHDADVRDDLRLRPGGSAPAARDAAAARCGRRQPAGHGRLRQRPGGDACRSRSSSAPRTSAASWPPRTSPHDAHHDAGAAVRAERLALQRPSRPCSSTAP